MKGCKNFFKRVFVLLIAVLMLTSATACGGGIKVTFMVDGAKYETVKVGEDGLVTLPTNPTKTDLSFAGWYLDEGTWQNKFDPSVPVTESVTVYARFAQMHNLNFYVHNTLYDTVQVAAGSTIELPADPVIDGFEFKGWFLKRLTGEVSATQVTADYFVEHNINMDRDVAARMELITTDNSQSGAYTLSSYDTLANLEVGDYIYMGEYPTTYYGTSVSLASQTPDAKGYYTGTDGKKYAKVESAHFNGVRDSSNFFQDHHTLINEGQTYWFKVEKIKWRIIEITKDANGNNDTALVMPTQVMFRSKFQNSTNAENNGGIDIRDYKASDVRAYMNNTLINQVFTEKERSVILTSWVDNSAKNVYLNASSTAASPWADTYDKLYLMSNGEREAINYQYRKLLVSDYQRATGCPMYTTETFGGDSGYTYWWARGRDSWATSSAAVLCGSPKGEGAQANVYEYEYGVVPLFRIDL